MDLTENSRLSIVCIRNSGYNRQAMHSYIRKRKPLISTKVEMRGFCLLRLCPNPRRTLVCVLETLEKSSGYAILQIAKWASAPVLFRFSRRGERIVSKNPIYICLGSLQGTHILPDLPVICVHGFFSDRSWAYSACRLLTVGSYFSPCSSKNCFAALCSMISDSCSERNFLE